MFCFGFRAPLEFNYLSLEIWRKGKKDNNGKSNADIAWDIFIENI